MTTGCAGSKKPDYSKLASAKKSGGGGEGGPPQRDTYSSFFPGGKVQLPSRLLGLIVSLVIYCPWTEFKLLYFFGKRVDCRVYTVQTGRRGGCLCPPWSEHLLHILLFSSSAMRVPYFITQLLASVVRSPLISIFLLNLAFSPPLALLVLVRNLNFATSLEDCTASLISWLVQVSEQQFKRGSSTYPANNLMFGAKKVV